MRGSAWYTDPGVAERPGSRAQVVLRDSDVTFDPDECVYVSVNRREGGAITMDVNDEIGDIDLVVQVTKPELLRLAAMFLQAAT